MKPSSSYARASALVFHFTVSFTGPGSYDEILLKTLDFCPTPKKMPILLDGHCTVSTGIEPAISCVTGRRVNRYTTRPKKW